MKRGRKSAAGIYDTLAEAVAKAPEKFSGELYRVEIMGIIKFLWATSAQNALRRLAADLGKADKVSTNEVLQHFKNARC